MSAPLTVAALGNPNDAVAVIDTPVDARSLDLPERVVAMPTKLIEP